MNVKEYGLTLAGHPEKPSVHVPGGICHPVPGNLLAEYLHTARVLAEHIASFCPDGAGTKMRKEEQHIIHRLFQNTGADMHGQRNHETRDSPACGISRIQ